MDTLKIVRMSRHPGSYVGYLSDMLVKDNTKDPLTEKYMLQSYGQYNVGILLVIFIQLYSLSQKDPGKYNFTVKSKLTTNLTYNYMDNTSYNSSW